MKRNYKAKVSDVESQHGAADCDGKDEDGAAAPLLEAGVENCGSSKEAATSDGSAPDPATPSSSAVAAAAPPAAPPTNAQLFSYCAIFFLSMIVHEIALEAASTSFSHLDALTSAVTLFQFGFCFLLPVCASGPSSVRETFPRTSREALPYMKLSLVVFGATALATKSLNYVTFPTKVVFKSAKLIPTMIASAVVNPSASKYGPADYLSAALLCAGAAGYSYGSGSSDGRESSSFVGIALLTTSIMCDALVPNLQQKLMAGEGGARKGGLSAAALMVNVNAMGFGGLLLYMIGSGSLMSSVRVAVADPTLLLYLALVGIGLSTAVLAYTRLIRGAGSVAAVAVATLRKVATVVLSYVIFPKPLLPVHVLSGLLVLAGVGLNVRTRQRASSGGGAGTSR
mmetsp:Transcript_10141/g.30000  ORF Transcript_10141/g.30000 Transcript_10141/m.30000 type:complete len:398 (-) Transcript_10141:309-1502(-)|eukprot:CAMPEP_0113550360 /NCGR_PEP_ID=MMETSP0015_2-20120614/13941_1 /TAXON_ID=2838 /ORGANISM="Odontella" /LENGTH=397 /DNA_ID=CAMNT_0000451163 /DNA_START=114 /DNA_END=1307 /DNA_ORIENTATION=+ /assembly_acc=CAM_ASM_000160